MATVDDFAFPGLVFEEQASTPDTPAAGEVRIYRGDDGVWYEVDDAGTVSVVNSDALSTPSVVKAADETINNDNTLQDDDELTFAIGANETVLAEFLVFYSSATTADIKLSVEGPAGSAGTVGYDVLLSNVSNTYGSIYRGALPLGGTVGPGGAGVGTKVFARLVAVIRNGETEGNVVLRWAQNSAEATDTVVHADSTIDYRTL